MIQYLKSFIPRPIKTGIRSLAHYTGLTPIALDNYVRQSPSDQTALDIFKGLWSSQLPAPKGDLKAGPLPLFKDERLVWAVTKLGGAKGKQILELGPLEGGHSYLLEKAGAKSVTAIEANSQAYLKCLVVKELLQMNKVHFHLGDFVEYLKANPDERFDFAVAHGVLYHMVNPVELLWLLSRVCDKLTLWTHYYDAEVMGPREKTAQATQGFSHSLYKHHYKKALRWRGFCGGPNPFANWLDKKELVGALQAFGFEDIDIAFDEPQNANGPSLALVAKKK